jgi:signal transduction histidine kinase/CheY-like chemotaxis protein
MLIWIKNAFAKGCILICLGFLCSLTTKGGHPSTYTLKGDSIRRMALNQLQFAKKNLLSFPEKSLVAAQSAQRYATSIDDIGLQARTDLLVGVSLYYIYRYNEADTYLKKAQKEFVLINNIRGQINVLKFQALIQSDRGFYSQSYPLFENASALSEKLKNDSITVDISVLSGYIYLFNNDIKNGFLKFDRAYQVARKSNKPFLLARTYLALGDWYNASGNLQAAIDFYHSSSIICDKLNDSGGYIWSMNKLGMLFAGWQRYNDALDYLRKALIKSDKNHILDGSGFTHRNLGEVYICKKEYNDALKNYVAAFKIEQIANNKSGMAESLCGEAEIMLKNKKMSKVGALVDSAIILTTGNIDPSIRAAISRINGLYNLELGNYSKARNELKQAILLSKNNEQIRLRLSSLMGMIELCQRQNKYSEAYQYANRYNSLRDSVFNLKSHIRLIERRLVYRSDEFQQRIKSLETDNKNDEVAVNNHEQIMLKQRLLILFGVIGSILFSLFLFLIYKQNRTIYQVNQLLNKKNEDILNQNEQIKVTLLQVQQSERLKTTFLSNMSHEIRTPMNAIMGFAELLELNDFNDEDTDPFLDQIISNSEVLLNIVDDIIDFAKIESGEITLSIAPCRIDLLLCEIENAFSNHLNSLQREKPNLSFKLPCFVQNLTLETDSSRLKKIINNLLDNALKFTAKGSIEFGVDKIQGNMIYFFVRDTGIGISEENKIFIFERFRQVEDTFTRRFGGIGLGLSLCKSFVEMLGGTIWLDSIPDKGSVFWFTLPVNNVLLNGNSKINHEKNITNHDWSNHSVLLLDGDSKIIQCYENILRPTHIKMFMAKDSYEAIEFCKSQTPPDLILMDIQSPRVNSIEAIKLFKRIIPFTPILAQAIKSLQKNGRAIIDEDFEESFYEPVQSNNLIEKLNNYFNHTI